MSKAYVIPKKLKVGFNNRSSTTNGKLGYVIFFDPKTNVLRKENSFESWRDKKIEPVEFENTKTSGFIFSDNIIRGGYYRYGNRVEKVRVYDPRGFDIEISVSNLMHIIEHYDIEKTEIKGELAYAWYETELILLPVVSEEYKNSVELTKKFNVKFSLKDLTVGQVYETKVSNSSSTIEQHLYLGRFKVNSSLNGWRNRDRFAGHLFDIGRKHIFGKIVDGEIESYSIVNGNLVVGTLDQWDDIKTNNEIIKFENSIHYKVFEKNMYIFKYKNEYLKKRILEGFRPYGAAYSSNNPIVNIGDRAIKALEVFSRERKNMDSPYVMGLAGSRYEDGELVNLGHYMSDQILEPYKSLGAKTPDEAFDKVSFFAFSVLRCEDGHFYDLDSGEIIDDVIEDFHLLQDVSELIDDKSEQLGQLDVLSALPNIVFQGSWRYADLNVFQYDEILKRYGLAN